MRYNCDTERGINIDEIAAQCKAAILNADAQRTPDLYDEILTGYRWEDDVLRLIPA